MADSSDTFANVIEGSRKIPEVMVGGGGSLDIPQMFQKETANPNVGEVKGGQGLQLKYVAHSAVYLIWRPWFKCGRCLKAIKNRDDLIDAVPAGEETELEPILPDVGEYTCPHNQSTDYKNILDRCLAGDFILRSEEPFNMVDGTRCIHIAWLETDPEQTKKLAEAKEQQEKNKVYPPDISGAFKDLDKDKATPEETVEPSNQKDQEEEPPLVLADLK